MSEGTDVQATLDELRGRLGADAYRLYTLVKEACPGPRHLARKHRHRDTYPAWCDSCGRTDQGQKIATSTKETG